MARMIENLMADGIARGKAQGAVLGLSGILAEAGYTGEEIDARIGSVQVKDKSFTNPALRTMFENPENAQFAVREKNRELFNQFMGSPGAKEAERTRKLQKHAVATWLSLQSGLDLEEVYDYYTPIAKEYFGDDGTNPGKHYEKISGLLKAGEAPKKAKGKKESRPEDDMAFRRFEESLKGGLFDRLAAETDKARVALSIERGRQIMNPHGSLISGREWSDIERQQWIESDRAWEIASRQRRHIAENFAMVPEPLQAGEKFYKPLILGLDAFADKVETVSERLAKSFRAVAIDLELLDRDPENEEVARRIAQQAREIKRGILSEDLGPIGKTALDLTDAVSTMYTAYLMAPKGLAIMPVFATIEALDIFTELNNNGVSRVVSVPVAMMGGAINGALEMVSQIIPGSPALLNKFPGGKKGFILKGLGQWSEEGLQALNRNFWVGKIVPMLQEYFDPDGEQLTEADWKRIGDASWEEMKAAGPVSFLLPFATAPVHMAGAALYNVKTPKVLKFEAEMLQLKQAKARKAELDARFEKAGVVEAKPDAPVQAEAKAEEKPVEAKAEPDAKQESVEEAESRTAAELEAQRQADDDIIERKGNILVLQGLFDEDEAQQDKKANAALAKKDPTNMALDDFRSQVKSAGVVPDSSGEGRRFFRYFKKGGSARGIDQWVQLAIEMGLVEENSDEDVYTVFDRLLKKENVADDLALRPPALFARDANIGERIDGRTLSDDGEIVVDKKTDGSLVTLASDGSLQYYRPGELIGIGELRGRASLEEVDAAQEVYSRKLADEPDASGVAEEGFFTEAEQARVDVLIAQSKKQLGRLSAGANPEIVFTLSKIAATYLRAGTRHAVQGFKDFSQYAIRELGEKVRPYLQPAWDRALAIAQKKEARAEAKEKGKADAAKTDGKQAQEEEAAKPLTEAEVDERNWLNQSDEVLLEQFREGVAEWRQIQEMIEQKLQEDTGNGLQDQMNKRRLLAIRKLMSLSDLPAYEKMNYAKAFYEAVSTDIMSDVMTIAKHINSTPNAILQPSQTVAFELKLEELEDERAQEWRKYLNAQNEGKVEEADFHGQRLESLRDEMNVITTAASKAGTSTAQALAARRWHTRRRGREIQLFYQDAVKAKNGRPFTPEEKAEVNAMQAELEKANLEVLKYAELAAKDALRARESDAKAHVLAMAQELWGKKRRRTKEKIANDRQHIFDELKKLGVRVNDLTGVPGRFGDLVARLVQTYIEEGIVSVDEIFDRVSERLPDASKASVIDVLASRPVGELDKAVKRAEERIRKTKKQGQTAARLIDVDEDDPKSISKAIIDLGKLIEDELDTNPDTIEVENLKRKVAHAEEMLRDRYRDIKKKRPPVSEEVAEWKRRLREIQTLIRTEDRIADLEHQIDTANFDVSPVRQAVISDERLRRAKSKLRRIKRKADALVYKMKDRNAGEKALLAAESVGHSMRMLTASGEASGWLRQGMMMLSYLAMRGPKGLKAIKTAFTQSFRGTFSQEYFDTITESIYEDPRHFIRAEAGLHISDPDLGILPGEEGFMRNVWEFLPNLISKLPHVKTSERNMIAALNLLRVACFDLAIESNPTWNQDQIKEWARIVNSLSGRSEWLKQMLRDPGIRVAAMAFFAPNFAMSRVEAPARLAWAIRPGSPLRAEAVKAGAGYVTANALFVGLSWLAGATISWDPEEFDFLRVAFGKTRVDLMAGLNQPFRVGLTSALYYLDDAGVIDGVRTSKPTDAFWRFIKYKRSPLAGVGDIIQGRDIFDRPTDRTKAILEQALPLYWADVYDTFKSNVPEDRFAATAAVALGGFFGAGTATIDNPLVTPSVREVYKNLGILKVGPPRWLYQVKSPDSRERVQKIRAEFNAAAAEWIRENPGVDRKEFDEKMKELRETFNKYKIEFEEELTKEKEQ